MSIVYQKRNKGTGKTASPPSLREPSSDRRGPRPEKNLRVEPAAALYGRWREKSARITKNDRAL